MIRIHLTIVFTTMLTSEYYSFLGFTTPSPCSSIATSRYMQRPTFAPSFLRSLFLTHISGRALIVQSSNVLVDNNYNLKICDFGLTHVKRNVAGASGHYGLKGANERAEPVGLRLVCDR